MDTKPVPTLTNFHKSAQEGTVLRRREQVHTQMPVPKVLEDYQQAAHVWSQLDGPGHQLPHAEPPLEEMVAPSLSTT